MEQTSSKGSRPSEKDPLGFFLRWVLPFLVVFGSVGILFGAGLVPLKGLAGFMLPAWSVTYWPFVYVASTLVTLVLAFVTPAAARRASQLGPSERGELWGFLVTMAARLAAVIGAVWAVAVLRIFAPGNEPHVLRGLGLACIPVLATAACIKSDQMAWWLTRQARLSRKDQLRNQGDRAGK